MRSTPPTPSTRSAPTVRPKGAAFLVVAIVGAALLAATVLAPASAAANWDANTDPGTSTEVEPADRPPAQTRSVIDGRLVLSAASLLLVAAVVAARRHRAFPCEPATASQVPTTG